MEELEAMYGGYDSNHHSRAEWRDLRAEVLSMGGIKPTGGRLSREDISGIPSTLIRRHGRTIDVIAAGLGYDYIGDFEDYVATTFHNYQHPKAVRKPRKAPKFRRNTTTRGNRRSGRYRVKTPKRYSAGLELKAKTVIVRAHTRKCPS